GSDAVLAALPGGTVRARHHLHANGAGGSAGAGRPLRAAPRPGGGGARCGPLSAGRGVLRRRRDSPDGAAAAAVFAGLPQPGPGGGRLGMAGGLPVRPGMAAPGRDDLAGAGDAGGAGLALLEDGRGCSRPPARCGAGGPCTGGRRNDRKEADLNAPVLSLHDVRKSFGPVDIIRGVSLDVGGNERHAVIGPNGAGKSTLFHLVSGQLRPSAGEIRLGGRPIAGCSPQAINRLGLARSFQITNLFPRLTVFENIRLAVMRPRGLQYCFWRLADRDERVRDRGMALLENVRLSHRASAVAGELSYSEQRSLEIAMTLASDPRI